MQPFLTSTGIYVISSDLLVELLSVPGNDFGNDIIPTALKRYRVMGYVFEGYWADIGAIRRFCEVYLELAAASPFELSIPGEPIYANARFLPPTGFQGVALSGALVAEGCRIADARIIN